MDAYTVKKVLPRLLVAVIAVQLSYFLVGILVDVFNILGNGIGNLILFGANDQGLGSITLDFGVAGDVISLVGLGLAIVNIPAILTALLPLLFVALMAVLGVLFTLIFRQMLIALLIILAPVAFVAWVLPNTERFFKMWWDFLLKALVMYPLIVALLASGILMSQAVDGLIPDPADGANALQSVLQVVVVVAPFLLIPFTFKFAGGALAAVAGGISSLRKAASKPLTDMSRQRFRDRRIRDSQGATRWSKAPIIGGAVKYGNAPYFSSRGKRGQEMKAAAAINERSKELASSLSFDQQNALALGKKGVEREVRDLEGKGKYQEAAKLKAAAQSVKGLANHPVDQAAAAMLVADAGFADEDMAKSTRALFDGGFGDKMYQQIQGKTAQSGQKSALAWGYSGNERQGKLVDVASKMSHQDILGAKDYKDLAPAFDEILRWDPTRAPAGMKPERASELTSARDALINNMYSAMSDTDDTSIKRRAEIAETLQRNGVPVLAHQPRSTMTPPTSHP